MKNFILVVSLLCCALPLEAQTAASRVPSVVKYSGTATDINNKPLTGAVGITFLLYKDQTGGPPLWMETQNVQADRNGHYSVMLGSESSHGLPAEAFATGEARWLGIQPNGQAEQPRVVLVSVPYALKAADAQTLNGLPASAFVLAGPPTTCGDVAASPGPLANSTSSKTVAATAVTTTGGTVNALPLWTTATNVQSSLLTQTATSAINVGGTLNLPATGTATAAKGFISRPETMVASVFNKTTGTAVAQTFQLQAEPANNDLATASGTLNLLYGSGTVAPTETGFKITNKGLVTFAAGQTFPGTGTGTVKSVALSAPSSDFKVTGSPVTSTGTLGLSWTVPPTSNNTINAIVKRDAVGSFLATAATVNLLTAIQVNANAPGTGTGVSGSGFIGVVGTSAASNGAGVSGISTGSAANGVYGSNPAHTGVYGDGAVGVWGHSNASVGVFGASFGNNGGSDGIHGETTSAGGSGAAGVNLSGSASGVGVFGTGGIGVHGESGLDAGSGVEAFNFAGGDGIFASGATGFAGFFNGNVEVNGTLSKAAGSFKIDHPIDPANKYLYHSFVESPDMMNIYNGNITTDGNGDAIVNLPDWFEPLNRDFRYQLTVLGQFAQAIISREVAGGRFAIKTNKPNVKVSWQVTGIRQDAWANAHRISVEVPKTEQERGFYLHPELFGAPQEKSIAAARHPGMQSFLKKQSAQQHSSASH